MGENRLKGESIKINRSITPAFIARVDRQKADDVDLATFMSVI